MEALTRRQIDVLNYIADVRASRGNSPTLREIASAFGLCVTSVRQHLRALKRKGYVVIARYARRGIRPTRTRREWKVRRSWQGDFEKRIGSRLRGQTDLRQIYAIVRDSLRPWLDVDRADLLIYDAHHRRLRGGSSFGVDPAGSSAPAAPSAAEPGALPPEAVRDPGIPAGPLADHAFHRRKPALETEADGSPLFQAERSATPGLRACAAIPVAGRDRVLGVLRLDDLRRPDGFDEVKLARAALAAAALAPALEQGTLHVELQRRIRLQSALVALCKTVNSPGDFQRILRDVHGIVGGLVDAPTFIIAVKDDTGQWWLLMDTDSVDGVKIEETSPRRAVVGDTPALRAVREGNYWILHRTPEEVRALEAQGPDAKDRGLGTIGHRNRRSSSLLYVPLRTSGETIGYMAVMSYTPGAYTVQDAEDLMLIGEYLGLAALNALREERARLRQTSERSRLERFDRLAGDLRRIAAEKGGDACARVAALAGELEALREPHLDPTRALVQDPDPGLKRLL